MVPVASKAAGSLSSLTRLPTFPQTIRVLWTTLLAVTVLSVPLWASASQAQTVSCTCRYKGQDFGVGESICIKGPNGMSMATCSMVLNNTSWEMSKAPCPLSLLDAPLRPAEPVFDAPAAGSSMLEPRVSKRSWSGARHPHG